MLPLKRAIWIGGKTEDGKAARIVPPAPGPRKVGVKVRGKMPKLESGRNRCRKQRHFGREGGEEP
jgi:hypothetical protein